MIMNRTLITTFATLAVSALGCGPKPTPAAVPVLPGDGDAHVTKPTTNPTKTGAPDPWVGRNDLIAPPAAKAPAKLELPAIEEMKLANGLTVFAIRQPRLPVVSMQLAIKAGRMQEPRARLGVAEATADMLVKGTKKRNAVGLAKAIDFVGGTIAADATFEATLVSCSVLARNLKTCLELVPEIMTQPTFPEDELSKVKDTMTAQVRQRLDDAGQLAAAHVQNLLWGNDHVRGWVDSETSIQGMRRDDLVAWHKTWYAPNNAILVVAGDIDPKKLKGDLERAFAPWKKANVSPSPTFKEPGLSGSRIRLVDKPGQTQTHIRIAQFGIRHDDPRFFESLVWNYALGGGAFSSRLMKVVRAEGGKTYGASSSFDRNIERGSFVVQTFTRNSEAVATVKLITDQIAKMAKDGPTQGEVDAAIANLAGGYGMRFQSASDLGAALLGAELHGFGQGYVSNYPLEVGKVTADAAKKASSEILDPRNYVIVLVGDAKDLEPQLAKAGWRYEKVSFTDPITKEVAQPAQPAPVADAKALAAARKFVDEAVVAKGGKAKLSAVKSLRMTAAGSTQIQGQKLPVDIERVYVVPDKMYIDATLTAGGQSLRVTVGVDGKTGWQRAPSQSGQLQVVPFQGKDVDQAQFEAWREPELLLLKAADPASKLGVAADETIDGKPQTVLKLVSPFGPELSLAFDKKTKLLSRIAFSEAGATQTEQFSDYKDVGGIKVAHKRQSTGQGRVTQLEIKKVEWDPKIDPSLFKMPAASATPAPAPAPKPPAPTK
jgi:zinc protease